MPPFALFKKADYFYSVLAHETIHATGHALRCNRQLRNRFGSAMYAAEELVAELGSAFLSAELQLDTEPQTDNAPYIENWLGARHFHGSQQSSAGGRLAVEYPRPGASRMSGLLTVPSFLCTDVSLYYDSPKFTTLPRVCSRVEDSTLFAHSQSHALSWLTNALLRNIDVSGFATSAQILSQD